MKGKLYHKPPFPVPPGARYHVRIRVGKTMRLALTDPSTAPAVLDAARYYHNHRQWYLFLMLLMPDHLHAIMAFPVEPGMSRTVGLWKHYLRTRAGIEWQDNYFDHRLRNGSEFQEKTSYVRMNPVRAGLCCSPEEWPWVITGDEA